MLHFGIIGKPLGHSQSKKFFDERFAAFGIDADYSIHEIEAIEEVVPLLDLLDGLNVTSPYKEAIIPYLNEIDPVAREIGAVNVVYKHHGYNTDWIGVTEAIKPYVTKQDRQAMVLGSGGAANAVRYALQQMGLNVSVVSRQPGKGDLTYAELTEDVIAAHRIIANCTPLGMFPLDSEMPDLPWDGINGKHLLFDCIYNPAETLFLKKGKEQGAQTVNGYAMFVAQAEAALRIFFN
ncbi:MAG: shikimate dehydrogenase [Paludibacteraceae bacterium]|nr:shikimate dehydrogenase [Paludibacteraceae bacterium]